MPEPLLLPGEVVLFATRRHGLWLAVPLGLLVTAILLLAGQSCPAALALRLDGRCPLVIAAGLAAAGLPLVLEWVTTRFVLTTHRLLRIQAPLALRLQQLELAAVASVTVQQSLPGRLFGYGDVLADSAATHGGRLVLDVVPDPGRLRDLLAAAVRERGPA